MALIGISGKIGAGKDLVGMILQGLAEDRSIERINEDITKLKFINYPDSPFEIKKFADRLKEITALLIGCTRQDLENRDFKESILGPEWNKFKLILEVGDVDHISYHSTRGEAFKYVKENFYPYPNPTMKRTYWGEPIVHEIAMTPRLILQLLGTEAGREIIHPDIWVNALISGYQNNLQTLRSRAGENGYTKYDKHNWIITDVRFPNEADTIKEKGGKVIRIERGPRNTNANEHPSETGLDTYENFDEIIMNDGSILDLIHKIKKLGYV